MRNKILLLLFIILLFILLFIFLILRFVYVINLRIIEYKLKELFKKKKIIFC